MTAAEVAEDVVHGTYAMYQREKRAGETVCDACRAAGSAYVREWRAANPEKYREELEHRYARRRALATLARRHSAELQSLIWAERQRSEASA